jgi:hypothetical protein
VSGPVVTPGSFVGVGVIIRLRTGSTLPELTLQTPATWVDDLGFVSPWAAHVADCSSIACMARLLYMQRAMLDRKSIAQKTGRHACQRQ